MSDPKRKISASIPISLLDQLQKIGYFSPTEAVLTGFELLVNGANLETKNSLEEYKNEIIEYNDKITEYKKEIAEYKGNFEECIMNIGLMQTENKSLTGQIEEYKKQKVKYDNTTEEYKKELLEYKDNIGEYRKDVTEYAIRIDSLQTENKIFQEYNTTLKQELEDTKELHRNYMMQMQTLINQKAIEVPGAKKPWWRFW